MKFLVSLRLPGGRFSSTYRCADGRGVGTPNPYADGEALLALVRAAKDDGADTALRDGVLESAAVMYGEYVRSRSGPTRTATTPRASTSGARWRSTSSTQRLARHPALRRPHDRPGPLDDRRARVLERGPNTGYAFEGLAVAWELARLTDDAKNQQHIADAIDQGLSKLLTLADRLPAPRTERRPRDVPQLPQIPRRRPQPTRRPRLRIDSTQHQMHATMLIRWLLLRGD